MNMLYHDVRNFLKRSGMTPTAFGRAALNDPCFVPDLRAGRQPGARVRARIYRFINEAEGQPGQCG